MAMVDVVKCCLQVDLWLKSVGLVQRSVIVWPVLHSSGEPGELWQWLCYSHDDRMINIILVLLLLLLLLLFLISLQKNSCILKPMVLVLDLAILGKQHLDKIPTL